MAKYGQVWPSMAVYGQIWPSMTKYGQVWPSMTKYGQKTASIRQVLLGDGSVIILNEPIFFGDFGPVCYGGMVCKNKNASSANPH